MTEEQTTIEKTELKIPTTFKALVEALIFAAREPLSINQLRSIYESENVQRDESRHVEPETIRQIIADLNAEFSRHDRPYRIVQIAGGYQFATLIEYAEWLGKLYKEQGRRKLSQSALETLAIIAYKQPITKAEVEKIRGVNCDYVLKNLLEKELLTVTGRAESVGRPLLYGTTREFLKHFGLNDITDLPRPREIEEILGESQFETERRMLEAQAGAEQARKEQEDFKSRLPHIPRKKPELDEKNVEISPHKILREIKIIPGEERKALAEKGQQKIEFASKNPSLEEPKPIKKVEDEKTRSEAPSGSFKGTIRDRIVEQESSVQRDIRHGIDLPNEMTDSVVESTKKLKLELQLQSGEGPSTINDLNQGNGQTVSDIEKPTTSGEQTQSRWKVWREKIQGFLKKLFA